MGTGCVRTQSKRLRARHASLGRWEMAVAVRIVIGPIVALFVALVLVLTITPPASAQSGAPPWAPCGRSDPADKPVKTYPVQPPVGGPTRTYAVLRCGDDKFGYRHIADKHGQQWADLAVYTGGPWQSLADFAITQTLTVPQPGYPRFNAGKNTWSYKSPLQIKDSQGQVRVTYWVIVGVAAQDGKVLTSFYSNDPR
jgi:hypothetical protein